MTVTYLLRSTKPNEPFYARLQISRPEKVSATNPKGLTFIETKTNIYVFTPQEVAENPSLNGKKFWAKYKKYKGAALDIKTRVLGIQSEQKRLKTAIQHQYSTSAQSIYFEPSREWLTSVVLEVENQDKEKASKAAAVFPNKLADAFDRYIELKGNLGHSTVLKHKDTKKIVLAFEAHQASIKGFKVNYRISDVDPVFQADLTNYMRNVRLYAENTIAKTIKTIKTICNYANNFGVPLATTYKLVGKPYEEKDVVFLTFSELKKIKETDVPAHLQDAKDWLYLSCFLGQRISDFMRFTGSMIERQKKDNGDTEFIINFTQQKTGKKIALVLNPKIIPILEERGMNFPPAIDESTYNDQIKKVCEIAKINTPTRGSVLTKVKKNLWRKVEGIHPKFELIGSHIGRKSFCTNFYNTEMAASLIMAVSGHSEERTLRAYIGKTDETKNQLISAHYKKIDIDVD